MLAISANQVQALDEWAIYTLGISRLALMENAGAQVAAVSISEVKSLRQALVLVYKGNNGGDGLVAARHLLAAGIAVKVFALCPFSSFKAEPAENLQILKKLGIQIIEVNGPAGLNRLKQELSKCQLLVDAVFGVGLSAPIKGLLAQAIKLVNQPKRPFTVVSVDVPSGIDATTGNILGSAIKADYTVTLSACKTGLVTAAGAEHAGKVVVAPIGIPGMIKLKDQTQGVASFNDYIRTLPKRAINSNKGQFGKVLVVAGSCQYSGAAILTIRSVFRSGAGLVYAAVPSSIKPAVNASVPEAIVTGLAENEAGNLTSAAVPAILQLAQKCGAIAIGPGLSGDQETASFVRMLLIELNKLKHRPSIVLDADGLNAVGNDPAFLKKVKSPLILTPHPGEMSRLAGKTIPIIQKQRVKIAQAFAKKIDAIVVLKGNQTVIASKQQTEINLTGNSVLSTAGTGDVLTGMIAAFLAQGLDPFSSARLGVYFHGLTADVLRRSRGERGILASDIVEALPSVLQSI